jgi:hypothetical protein
MSRLDDLISLIRTVNEVYFITAPERVKAAYLLVDDILELACKTFLQYKTSERREQCRNALKAASLLSSSSIKQNKAFDRFCEDEIDIVELCQKLGQTNHQSDVKNCIDQFRELNHWSANHPEAFIEFGDVIDEVQQEFVDDLSVRKLLDEVMSRHRTRNKFYHDHHQSGLTINDEKCLKALCEMFDLMECLFPNFLDKVKQDYTVRCQIGVLRLKQTASTGQSEVKQPFLNALGQINNQIKKEAKRREKDDVLNEEQSILEHSLVHTVSDRFFNALQEEFVYQVDQLKLELLKDDNRKRRQRKHDIERRHNENLIQILQGQLDQINALLGTP